MIQPWPLIGSKELGHYRVFRLRVDEKRSPRTGQTHDFFILEAPHWVHVVALTPDEQLVMVEQYRHGTNRVELELPGGVMDSHETSPLATAVRELREETGYEGQAPELLAEFAANPAILTNTCYIVVVRNCHLRHPLQQDHGEDLQTRLVPAAAIAELVKGGHIRHSVVLAGLYYLDLWRRGHP